uniref:RHO family interacting cell polarization regulator 1 n=1 Tax=Salarias fasciatus TaxID=181472 RepID=A0A672FBQ3_SALFA
MMAGFGSPSRTLSTMSLSVRPVRRLTSRSITRSQSFTGVNTYDKAYRSLSVFSTPGLSRKPSRASRMFTASTKANPPPKVPQPERLDQVYDALKTGLQSHLQVHQMDLDSLTRQMKESKRNSRLVHFLCVCQQVKVTERYIRRLEFHLSKIEELYEAYCLQRRLRDGADKMVKAYTASPGSKEARESLAEANKGYKEYTENMCVLESEFENQLGEFHIRMKGLAGFARLCAGDQYEILMKYGRQRWKLRGRIEINAKQVWDSEEMVFLPLISDFLCVKVTELKSLANHVVVGNVSCETKDLFAALPQTVAVDINDLGTIKLSLEVTWNPFDKDDQGSVTSTVNKAPSVSKRFSTIFNQSPPDTPSLREQAFFNMLRRREELENGAAWSNSSESSDDSSPQLPAQGPRNSTRPTVRRLKTQQQDEECTAATTVEAGGEDSTEKRPVSVAEDPVTPGNGACRYARSLSHISESSADGAAPTDRSAGESADATSPISRISISDIEMELRGRTQEPPGAADSERSEAGGDGVAETLPSETNGEDGTYAGGGGLEDPSRAACGVPDSGLEDALGAVVSSLDDYRGQFPELQLLEQELKLLQATLKGGSHSRSPSVFSLTVETALGSFDFLNTSDCEEEEEEEEERGGRRSRGGSRSLQDRGFSPPSSPLTTGCSTLDGVLVVHLKNCGAQLLRLGTFGPLRCGEMYALDKLLREARVLEVVRRLIKENPRRRRQPAEVIPQLGQTPGAASLWQQCVGKQGSVYSTTADTLLLTLASAYATVLPSPADVFLTMLLLLKKRLPRRGNSRSEVTVTLFQLWSYLEANGVGDMDTHVTELAEEVRLVETLSSCDQDLIVQALRRPPECSLRREGLHAVASSVLRSLAAQPRQRERALVGCLELLEQSDVEARVCGCKALASLKAKESIDQLVYLCQTDKEEVRDAAKQTLLVLGEEGKMAHRHVETSQDSLPRLFAPGSMASTAF